MEKEKIVVPGEVRYISEWENFTLLDFPHILDKKIPGCGFTEYCITNGLDSIVCSPRRMLLENKEEQHPGEIFYFRSEMDKSLNIDKDLFSNVMTKEEVEDKTRKLMLEDMESSLRVYIEQRRLRCLPVKLIVTYDSFRLLKEVLVRMGIFDNFYVVVDEFQSIFTDSRFKSDTEMEFINYLKDIQKLCFVSATPMIDTYLEMLPEFKDLPYYELDWETKNPGRVLRPDLKVKVIKSVVSQAVEIINTYKSGNFESAMDFASDGSIIEIFSKEAVLYVNSVKNIVSIIKKSGLSPDQVNILCADTKVNRDKIKTLNDKELGYKFDIGKVPLKGDPHKMFTLCTRTVYLGADFYSTNARTFILSDANIDTLAVDITLDLPQILGRQRLLENPWKNRAELYFKSITKNNKLSKTEFDNYLMDKLSKTDSLLSIYNKGSKKEKHDLAGVYQDRAKSKNYKEDFVAVNTHGGKDLFPVRNELVLISEKRAFDIQQIDYADRFTVFNKLSESGFINSGISEFIQEFNSLSGFHDKMRALCESSFNENERMMILEQVPLLYKNMYLIFGPVRLKAKSYNITNLRRELLPVEEVVEVKTPLEIEQENRVRSKIYNTFEIGHRYLLSDIKNKLGDIYKDLDYKCSPKASDLEVYFDLGKIRFPKDLSGRRSPGYEILKKKDL